MLQESHSKGMGERQATGEGRGGERGERGVEGDAREGRPPGLAGDRQAACPASARGPATNTGGSRDPMTSAVVTCVHAGRWVKKNPRRDRKPCERAQTHREKEGGERSTGCAKNKYPAKNVNAPPEDTQHRGRYVAR